MNFKNRKILYGAIVVICTALIFPILINIINKWVDNLDSSLKIVDISIDDSNRGFPIMDIKLRNTLQETAFLKEVQIDVQKIFYVIPECRYDAIPSSGHYDIFLPIKTTPYSQSVSISQSIKSNEVDRFNITLGNNSPYPSLGSYIFMIKPKIKFNENGEQEGKKMIFSAEGIWGSGLDCSKRLDRDTIKELLSDNSILSKKVYHFINS